MKCVSDIIAIILILLITISLAGLAYLWFTGIFKEITGGVGNQTELQRRAMATKFNIETAIGYPAEDKVGLVIRNQGSVGLDMQNLATYVDNILYTGREGLSISTLSSGAYIQFNITGVTSDICTLPLRITADVGTEDTLTITC